jgi:uncharacterized protein
MPYFDTSYTRLYHPRPMSRDLPETVDPIRLADARTHLSGELPVSMMSRLRAECVDHQGQATVDLYFERSGERGLRRIRGTISARVRVACQRCLEPMTLPLRAEPLLVVVKRGERPDLANEEDQLLVVDGPMSLSDMVEDELLLAMPMIPKHELGACPATAALQRPKDGGPPSPFASLQRLKHKPE